MKKIFVFISIMMIAVAAMADDNESRFNPVSTAVVSQTIVPDARAGSMGDVGAATDPDAVSQFWNPAKYPFCISRAGVALNYTPWLRQLVPDMDIAYLSGYYRIGDYSAISASLKYFSLGEVYMDYAGDDDPYSNAQTINPYEMSVDLAYSLMLSEKFSLAAGIRYILSDMSYSNDEEKATSGAFAADLAWYYQDYLNIGQRECQLGLGMNVSNVGSKITYSGSNYSEFIPTNLRLGASLMIPVNEYNRFTIAADANKLLVPTRPKRRDGESPEDFAVREQRDYYDVSSIAGIFKSFSDAPGGFKEELEEIQWSLGAEYIYNDRFALRAGYHHEAENKGNRKYFTVGAGFKMSAFSLDAGYVIATAKSNPLDQTLRFTLTFDMDGLKDLFGGR